MRCKNKPDKGVAAFAVLVLLSFLFFLGYSAELVSATGIASRNNPSIVDFEPNGEFTTTWRVTSQRTGVAVNVSGTLAQYANLSRYFIANDDEDKTFTVTFKFPAKVDTPGRLAHSVIVEEVVGKHKYSIGTAINARWTFFIRVPYEGKYIETELTALNTDVNKTTPIDLVVFNRGTEPVKGVSPRLDIYTSKNDHLKTFYFREIDLAPKNRYDDQYLLDTTGYNPGEYTVISSIEWPGVNTSKAMFIIGSQSLRVLNYKKNISAGKIDKFVVELFNDWDKVLNSVYAEIEIDDQKFKTPPTQMGPWSTSVLESYIDARTMEPGEKKAKLTIYYDGKASVEEITIIVLKKELGINLFGKPSEKEIPGALSAFSFSGSELFSITNILVAVVVLLVIVTFVMITKMGKVETLITKQIESMSSESLPGKSSSSEAQPSEKPEKPATATAPIDTNVAAAGQQKIKTSSQHTTPITPVTTSTQAQQELVSSPLQSKPSQGVVIQPPAPSTPSSSTVAQTSAQMTMKKRKGLKRKKKYLIKYR